MRRSIGKPSNPVQSRASDAGSGTALVLVTSRMNLSPSCTNGRPSKLIIIWFAVKVGAPRKSAALAGSMLTPEIVTPENRYCGPVKDAVPKEPARLLVMMISVPVKVVVIWAKVSTIDVDEEIVCGPTEKPTVLVFGKRKL